MKFLAQRITTSPEGEYFLKNGNIPVRKILACLDNKISKKKILEKLPQIRDSDIHACKAWAIMVMEDRHEYKRNKELRPNRKTGEKGQHAPVKFMFDENLSWKIIPEVANNISEVSQIHLEDMAGAKDIEIWEKFRTNGSRAVIVTQDDDFIRLAKIFAMHAMMTERRFDDLDQHLKDTPFVVHIQTKKKNKKGKATHSGGIKKDDVIRGFKKHAQIFVKEAMRTPQRCAYMVMTKDGFFKGPSLREIFSEFLITDKKTLSHHGLANIPVEDIDLGALNFRACLDWKKLNTARKKAELPAISHSDYG